ncbi:hypothetical protein C1H76_3986 [Elsinoe australis]|uniref:Uncharacterized protein n=1 Tax=Elsinoe australis TaxID=40998 RepID=A0A4U7B8A3_9PEZI|nr:hypothetical protein C1H76_3986 [Elsinoe australis]
MMADALGWKPQHQYSVSFSKQFHLNLSDHGWGYVIYRTVYTTISNARFHEAVDKLEAHVRFHINWQRELHPEWNLDPVPDQLLLDKLNLVVEDDEETLDQASDQVIRGEFDKWVQDNQEPDASNQVSHSVCLVINEESPASLLDTPVPTKPTYMQPREPGAAWVRVVDRYFNESHALTEHYYGWMRADVLWLTGLYSDLDGMEMLEICPRLKYEGQIPLFDGDYQGRLIDPPGGIEGRPKMGGTPRGRDMATQWAVERAEQRQKAAHRTEQRRTQGGTQRGAQGGTQRGVQGGTQRGVQGGTQRGP